MIFSTVLSTIARFCSNFKSCKASVALRTGMSIGLIPQIALKCKYVFREPKLKLLHILAITLASYELGPRLKEIFERDDVFMPNIELGFCLTV